MDDTVINPMGFTRELQPDEIVSNLIRALDREANQRYPSPVELRKMTVRLREMWQKCQDWLNGADDGEGTGVYDDGLPF